ncbi:MAG: hypothetical protein ACU85V_02230 [Gammaproteobacteria bacterium]
MESRFFSDEELEHMGKRTVDRLTEAIDAGDPDQARKLARRMYNEFLGMHDLYRNWITATLSEVGRRYGDEALDDIMVEGVRAWWKPIMDKLPSDPADLPAKVRMFVSGLHGHLQPMDITEDEDKIEIRMQPCGSGGRLVQEGSYEGEDGFLKIRDGQKMTYGRDDYPVYCAHEYAMERVDIEEYGRPFVVVEPAARLGQEACVLCVYKDPAKIPAKYYERIGKKKPA